MVMQKPKTKGPIRFEAHASKPLVTCFYESHFIDFSLEDAHRLHDELGDALEEAEAKREGTSTQARTGSVGLTQKQLEHAWRSLTSHELEAIGAGRLVEAIKSVVERREKEGYERSISDGKAIVDGFKALLRG